MRNNNEIIGSKRVLMSAMGLITFASMGVFAAAKPKERVIKVIAKKFVFVPNVIEVKHGETVVLHLTAPEIPMGINFAEFGMRADILPGKVTMLRLTPDKVGSFTFLCDVFCGSGHEEMSGSLVVS
jgi:cytochrome c oxidase subunit II